MLKRAQAVRRLAHLMTRWGLDTACTYATSASNIRGYAVGIRLEL